TVPMTEPLAPPEPGENPDETPSRPGPDQAGGGPGPGDQGRLARAWHRWRLLAALLALLILACVVAVVLAPTPRSNSYLAPASSDTTGTKALADILADRGFAVTSVYSPQAALAALGSPPGRPASTLVITSPGLLTAAQRGQLARVNADLLLVEPGRIALAA